MPIAPSVPRITLITVAITATSTVSRSACRMSGLFVNSSTYPLNENPSHLARVFLKVTLPLSVPGVVSGVTMVFMPAVTTFAISSLLGNGKFMLLGDMIEQQFMVANEWGFGSALSLFMMALIVLSMSLLNLIDRTPAKEGSAKW